MSFRLYTDDEDEQGIRVIKESSFIFCLIVDGEFHIMTSNIDKFFSKSIEPVSYSKDEKDIACSSICFCVKSCVSNKGIPLLGLI